MKYLIKHPYLLLVLASSLMLLPNLGLLEVNIMEARNFITAREMLQDGNWIFTTLNGSPRYEKPPLPTWLTAISGALFGIKNIAALRLPAVLLTGVLLLFFFRFTNILTKQKELAAFAGCILVSSFYILFSGRNGQWDIFTHGFMMGCIYYLYLFFSKSKPNYSYAVLAGVFFGASFLSKGPVSLYALLLPFLIAYGVVYKFKGLKNKLGAILLFIGVALLTSGWWHWYVYTFDTQAITEITKKETSNWSSYNIRPFYYYWSFFTQSGIWTLPAFIGLLYPYLKKKVTLKKEYLFSLIWTLSALILLSIIPEKKSRYLLPVLIPLALNTSFYIEYLKSSFSKITSKAETFPVYFNFGLIATIGVLFPIGGILYLGIPSLKNYLFPFILCSIALVTIGILMFKYLKQKNISYVMLLSFMFIASVMCFGFPIAPALYSNPNYNSISSLPEWQKTESIAVYEYDNITPELVWWYGGRMSILNKNEQGEPLQPNEHRYGVLVSKENLESFQNTFKNSTVEKINEFDLNTVSPEKSGHKNRLQRTLFLITESL